MGGGNANPNSSVNPNYTNSVLNPGEYYNPRIYWPENTPAGIPAHTEIPAGYIENPAFENRELWCSETGKMHKCPGCNLYPKNINLLFPCGMCIVCTPCAVRMDVDGSPCPRHGKNVHGYSPHSWKFYYQPDRPQDK